jgi:polysaccharide deacetylase 2 family uncharacterized protein YibQ
MKRRKKKTNPVSRRVTVTFLFLTAIAGLLFVALSVWPAARPPAYERPDQDMTLEAPGEEEITAAVTAREEGRETAAVIGEGGKIAVVIDDAGYDLASLERFLAFKGQLTIAVLPQLPYSTRAAERTHRAGKEVMLHLPLEPLGDENPGPGVLEVAFNRARIRAILDENFASVPFVRGVNNHMGSLATQDHALMQALFLYLREHDKYFVDSRTTAASLGREYASRFGIPWAERTYFLDNTPERGAVTRVLNEGAAYARVKGRALLIGHVQNTAVIEVLEDYYDDLTAAGFKFVTVSEYVNDGGKHP